MVNNRDGTETETEGCIFLKCEDGNWYKQHRCKQYNVINTPISSYDFSIRIGGEEYVK